MSLLALFISVHDFCMAYAAHVESLQLESQAGQRPGSKPRLSLSAVMTRIIYYHQSSYRTFKDYYQKEVLRHRRSEFPQLVSYNRFVELMPEAKAQWVGSMASSYI